MRVGWGWCKGQRMTIRELYPLEGEAPRTYRATFLRWVGEDRALVMSDGGSFTVPLGNIVELDPYDDALVDESVL